MIIFSLGLVIKKRVILCIRISIHAEHACIFDIILVIKCIYQSIDLAGFTVSYEYFGKKKNNYSVLGFA